MTENKMQELEEAVLERLGEIQFPDDPVPSVLLPIAKVQYRCPWTEESYLVGPSDYKIYIPATPKNEPIRFVIQVNCHCGSRHDLATGEFD